MVFKASVRKLASVAMSIATFMLVSHLFLLVAVPVTSAGTEVHHDVATHDHKDTHTLCPTEIHQFTQSNTHTILSIDCANSELTYFRVSRLETLFRPIDYTWPYPRPPKESKTVLLI